MEVEVPPQRARREREATEGLKTRRNNVEIVRVSALLWLDCNKSNCRLVVVSGLKECPPAVSGLKNALSFHASPYHSIPFLIDRLDRLDRIDEVDRSGRSHRSDRLGR